MPSPSRLHRHQGRARAQSQERRPRAAAQPADRRHRAFGLRQIVARVRHDLRRRAAPLRRVALVVRAAVPGADGEARRRLHRGALAGDLDRPEVDLAQSALDGRHGHRDLRLPAPAVRARRHAALLSTAAARSARSRASRSSIDHGRCPRARASRCSRRWFAAARASTRSCSRRSAKEGFARVRVDGEIRELREKIDARQEAQAYDRGGRRPARHQAGHPQASDRFGRDDAAALDRHRHGAHERIGELEACRADVQRGVRLRRTAGFRSKSSPRGCSRSTRRTAPVPSCSGLGEKIEIDPWKVFRTAASRSPTARSCRGAAAWAAARYPSMNPYYMQQLERVLRARRVKMTTPIEKHARRRRRIVILYGTDKEQEFAYKSRGGQDLGVPRVVRRRREQPAAPLRRDLERLRQGRDREVHVGLDLPRLQGRASQARGARGDDRRPQHRRRSRRMSIEHLEAVLRGLDA